MFDSELLREKLIQISEALDRVARRFEGIHSADDFLVSEHGMDMLDGICMMLIAVGENFKSIDRMTDSQLLEQYPEVNWRGVKGVRDVISHQYFNIDAEEIHYICSHDLEKRKHHTCSFVK
ncbi:MAG: HepT-like ribonuclease domain-containing protein [Desulforhopalus sp.]